jgi:hypothetical protein
VLRKHKIDICGISEHWLYQHNLDFLNSFDSQYRSFSRSDKSLLLPSSRRVGKGGVSILWHIKYDKYISPIDIDDDRIVGIQLQLSPSQFVFFFQVYLPCRNHAIACFREYIDKLYDIWNMYCQHGLVIFMGDFNSSFLNSATNDSRNTYLLNLANLCNIVPVNSLSCCTGASSTFVTYDNQFTSTIDYIFMPAEYVDTVAHCEILDDDCLNVSRHRPVLCTVNLPLAEEPCDYSLQNDSNVSWKKVTQEHIDTYLAAIHSTLSGFEDAFTLNDEAEIERFCSFLTDTFVACGAHAFPKSKFRHYLKPYWNEQLSDFHAIMRQKRDTWCREGRPRNPANKAFYEYKSSKRIFRNLHRKCISVFEINNNEEINKTAELDKDQFWKLVNKKRNSAGVKTPTAMSFNGQIFRDQRSMKNQWQLYFENLYSPTVNEMFDQQWYDHVNILLNEAVRNSVPSQNVTVSSQEVKDALKSCKRNKACGYDMVYYEHFILGGDRICDSLSYLFSSMLKNCFIPESLKKGVIVTLHKGGNKRKDNPDNYRAISLTPATLKVFEKILLNRSKDIILSKINPQQGGFQDGLSCLMTSFYFKESILYGKEQGSKVHVCFLDAKQAFDRVWHEGLLWKLFNCNLDSNTFLCFVNLYTEMKSCVKFKGELSQWFNVMQGTRQGGISSPILYLLFINDLINELQESGLGCCIYNFHASSPTVADDMVLLSYSVSGLQKMIDLCNNYSRKWRFLYNASKCSVITFNATSLNNNMLKLGNELVPTSNSYKHLGILCDNYLNMRDATAEINSKLRSTFFSLLNCGLLPNEINPTTWLNIYHSIVLPKALYGCELINSLSQSQLLTLEKSHRLCLKRIQGLPISASNEIALGALGVYSIESIIDTKKLLFFGQLCRLPAKYLAKRLFIHRLLRFLTLDLQTQGFIPDIYRLVVKYNLKMCLDQFLITGNFPSKQIWNRQVTNNIINYHYNERKRKIIENMDIDIFENFFDRSNNCILWELRKNCNNSSWLCKTALSSMCRVYAKYNYPEVCSKCKLLSNNIILHKVHHCTINQYYRNDMYNFIINQYGFPSYFKFMKKDSCNQIFAIVGGLKCASDNYDVKVHLMLLRHLIRLLT